MRIRVGIVSAAIAIVFMLATGISAQDPMDGTWGAGYRGLQIRPRPGTQE